MRYLILSDIHSNDEALGAVLSRVRRKKFDKVVILGDFVGYGANPNQIVERIRKIKREKIMIRGNHDKVVVGTESGDLFNSVALEAARWTGSRLTPSNWKYIESSDGGRPSSTRTAVCYGLPPTRTRIFFPTSTYLNLSAGS